MIIPALTSSKSPEWPTPQKFYDALHAEFNFTLDPCCQEDTAKCARFYTPETNGLVQDWSKDRVFMNPPYGDPQAPCSEGCTKKRCSERGFCHAEYVPGIIDWMRKAHEESQKGALVVCLVPSRTDTRWWHAYAAPHEIRFVKGRLKFGDGRFPAPFPSAVVVMRHRPKITL